MRTSVQNGTDDEIHNDGIDHDEIELTKCLIYQIMKEKAEKMSLRPKIDSKPKVIKLNKAPRDIDDGIHNDEIELTTSLNELNKKAKYQSTVAIR